MTRVHPKPLKAERRWHQGIAFSSFLISILQFCSTALADVEVHNRAAYIYRDRENLLYEGNPSAGTFVTLPAVDPLIDPLGQILGCNGSLLEDYTGFSVGLYEPDATGLAPGSLLALTPTEVPDIENNGVSAGKSPNDNNINPFPLTNANEGTYNFLFDAGKSLVSSVNAGLRQADEGARYILVVNPPESSELTERRILITILESTGAINDSIIRYQAEALDGLPLSATGGIQITDTIVEVLNAETQGLTLFSLAFSTVMCSDNQVRITKSADRGAAQPGDTAVYRLLIQNLAEVPLDDIVITDILPRGFRIVPEATRAAVEDLAVPIETEASSDGLTVTFSTTSPIPVDGFLEIIYAAQITPDAIRGDGRNSVVVDAERTDNDFAVQDGPVSHLMRLDLGILSDCGTLIGRVFIDKNFDGEQQLGEPGIPNAVVFLDDGNRIVTDENGLFSVACILAGRRTGALDLSSLPGYTLAPNLYFKERNSQSRLVNLAPGGLVRMNFAVTPTFQEEAAQ